MKTDPRLQWCNQYLSQNIEEASSPAYLAPKLDMAAQM